MFEKKESSHLFAEDTEKTVRFIIPNHVYKRHFQVKVTQKKDTISLFVNEQAVSSTTAVLFYFKTKHEFIALFSRTCHLSPLTVFFSSMLLSIYCGVGVGSQTIMHPQCGVCLFVHLGNTRSQKGLVALLLGLVLSKQILKVLRIMSWCHC